MTSRKPKRLITTAAAMIFAGGMFATVAATSASSAATSKVATAKTSDLITSTGLKAGSIKHVWLIIMENKSYDATFTGLNQNTYLWQTLPQQGVLLKNYFGTGHASQDNYAALISGQGPSEDLQNDCATNDTLLNTNAGIGRAGGSLAKNSNYGQLYSKGGANAPLGANGCTYPSAVPTLFNQFNAAGVTWKDYSQDLTGAQNYVQSPNTPYQAETVPGRDDSVCGGPGTSANNAVTNPINLNVVGGDVASYTGTQNFAFNGTTYIDQYVAKHNPAPWFESVTGGPGTTALNEPKGGSNCDTKHIANLDSPANGLVSDLKNNTVPAFSWITPNNCSDAHDASCKGNNLSGAFNSSGSPDYKLGTSYQYDPETVPPANYTGGLYAGDLFLKYYIPLIEQSKAFRDGGLIDVTFDEGFPAFTYSGNSFNNATSYAATSSDKPNASAGIAADAAGENINGKNVATEPTGPNSTLATNTAGQQLYPGPGNNQFIDRPPVCTSVSPNVPANCVPGIVRGGSGNSPTATTEAVTGQTGTLLNDNSIISTDIGRGVTGTNIPANAFVGAVNDGGPLYPTVSAGAVTVGSFQLVDQAGNPLAPTGAVTSVTLSAEGAPGYLTAGQTPDPLYDATDATPGGGDTGAVLISKYIKPGSVASTYYNHYSWLRTMEDIFNVDGGKSHKTIAGGVGSVSGGLDNKGHIGYAAQAGLAPFGSDVFTNPTGKKTK